MSSKKEIVMELDDLEDAIAISYGKLEKAAQATTVAAMELGCYLQQARDQFNADQDFGQWREENTPVSADIASRMMQVWNTYKGQDVSHIGFTVLREMASLPEPVKQELIEREKPPTIKEVREIKSGDVTSAEDSVAKPAPEDIRRENEIRAEAAREKAAERKAMSEHKGRLSMVEKAKEAAYKPFMERINEYPMMDADAAIRCFGLCEFDEFLPNPEVIQYLYGCYQAEILDEDEHLQTKLQDAYDEIMAAYENHQ